MQYKDLQDFVASINKGQLGINIVVCMPCDNKLLASGRYLMGRVKKVTIITNARLGVKFESKVEAKGDGTKYNVEAPKGFTWVDFPFFKKSNKTGDIYLNLNYRQSDSQTRFESVYLLDDMLATSEEINEIESHMKKSSSYSKKQAAYGITDEREQTKVVSYKADFIKYIGTDKEDAEQMYVEYAFGEQ